MNETTRAIETPYGTFEVSVYFSEHTTHNQTPLKLVASALSSNGVVVNNKSYGDLRLEVHEAYISSYIWSELTDSARTKLHAALWPTVKEMLESSEVQAAALQRWRASRDDAVQYKLERAQEDANRESSEIRKLWYKTKADLGV